ncbi:hypothetical protein FBUS_05751 [Fasciolopsis buskii]|uniref:Uncharacterized protein n=1 Tax=Fasciolopsis buskii TaxID=27845 RepID=A0A8E0RUG0_9TREM|nr:hypothetical protein FBUS_05751 [Fasciolopsis buski]
MSPEPSVSNTQTAESGSRTLPGMIAVSRFVGCQDSLIVCGPASGSVEPVTSCSPVPGSSGSAGGGDGSNVLGVYRSSVDGSPQYCALGRMPSAVLRGRITALSSLSESGLLIAGTLHGSLSLIH